MKITICGSMSHEPLMRQWQQKLEAAGYETEMPSDSESRLYNVAIQLPA